MKGKLNPDAGQASAAETPESLPTAQLAEHRLDHALATTIAFTVLVLAQLGSQGVFRRIDGIALDFAVRRAKARPFSGCESRPATFAPAGSNWSSRGGNEAAEASGIEGSLRNLANMQAVM